MCVTKLLRSLIPLRGCICECNIAVACHATLPHAYRETAAAAPTLTVTVLTGHVRAHCNTLQHTAPHCSTRHHTVTHCNTLQAAYFTVTVLTRNVRAHRNTLQHTAPHCNTLQHTANPIIYCCCTHETRARTRARVHALCSEIGKSASFWFVEDGLPCTYVVSQIFPSFFLSFFQI